MFLVSEVFDARKHPFFCSDKSTNKPWTFIINNNGILSLPCTGPTPGHSECGFATKQEAEQARNNVKQPNCMYLVVNKIEYNRKVEKLFASPANAHEYVMRQPCSWGGVQTLSCFFSVNVKGNLYASASYSEYEIVEMEVED